MLNNPQQQQQQTSLSLIGNSFAGMKKSTSLDKFGLQSMSPDQRRSFVQQLRMKVVENNIRGKTLDKITIEQSKPEFGPIVSTYGIDFCRNGANATADNRPNTTILSDPKLDTFRSNALSKSLTYTNGFRPRTKKDGFITRSNPNLLFYSQELQNKKNQQVNEEQENKANPDTNICKAQSLSNLPMSSPLQAETERINRKPYIFDESHPFANELNNIVNENAEYFKHISGLCACGSCECGKHKCRELHLRLKQKGHSTTVYQKDFVKQPIGDPIAPLKNDFFTSVPNNVTMSLATTMKTDFKSWNVGPPPRVKEISNFHPMPFVANSSYRGDFINWGSNPVNIEKASQPLTTISELPFIAKTTYKETHGSWAPSQTISQKKKEEKSPLSPGIPFLGETTTMKTYKPFRIGPNTNYKQNKEKWESTNTFPEQYKSIFAKDFDYPNKGKCPGSIDNIQF